MVTTFHSIERAMERYGLELTPLDIQQIETMIEELAEGVKLQCATTDDRAMLTSTVTTARISGSSNSCACGGRLAR